MSISDISYFCVIQHTLLRSCSARVLLAAHWSWSQKSQEQKKPKKEEGGSKKLLADVCKLYNSKACKQQAGKECKTTWGRTLRHACNKFPPGGKVCLKDHPRCDHV